MNENSILLRENKRTDIRGLKQEIGRLKSPDKGVNVIINSDEAPYVFIGLMNAQKIQSNLCRMVGFIPYEEK